VDHGSPQYLALKQENLREIRRQLRSGARIGRRGARSGRDRVVQGKLSRALVGTMRSRPWRASRQTRVFNLLPGRIENFGLTGGWAKVLGSGQLGAVVN